MKEATARDVERRLLRAKAAMEAQVRNRTTLSVNELAEVYQEITGALLEIRLDRETTG